MWLEYLGHWSFQLLFLWYWYLHEGAPAAAGACLAFCFWILSGSWTPRQPYWLCGLVVGLNLAGAYCIYRAVKQQCQRGWLPRYERFWQDRGLLQPRDGRERD
jgi:hypothetical protein